MSHAYSEPADSVSAAELSSFEQFIAALRTLQDQATCSAPPATELAALTRDIAALTARLADHEIASTESAVGTLAEAPGRAHPMLPPFLLTDRGATSISGVVTFGPFYTGKFRITHGGAIALLFDEVLGRQVNEVSDIHCRTAYLKVDYRSPVPEGRPLHFDADVTSIEGRKVYASGQLYEGDRLLAECAGLFIQVAP
jgi:acyl-coenzyme A thioesterase PaaI-like protein